jgi:hypothetical protein
VLDLYVRVRFVGVVLNLRMCASMCVTVSRSCGASIPMRIGQVDVRISVDSGKAAKLSSVHNSALHEWRTRAHSSKLAMLLCSSGTPLQHLRKAVRE